MTVWVERALNSYSALEVETGIDSASPQRLIIMLYEGAIKSVFVAKTAMARGDVAAKGAALSKAISIVEEGLRPALNLENGGEIAQNLMALYEYISMRLLHANLKNDSKSLDEAARLLSELKHAWEILEQRDRPAAIMSVEPPERRASVSLGKA
jgi:flagellar secretion chaperone FliS